MLNNFLNDGVEWQSKEQLLHSFNQDVLLPQALVLSNRRTPLSRPTDSQLKLHNSIHD